eukprot:11369714-Alexandrium_andersonii.AAC.1
MATGAAFAPPVLAPPDLICDPNVQVLDEVLPPAPFFGLPPLGGHERHGPRYVRKPWEAPPEPVPIVAPAAGEAR